MSGDPTESRPDPARKDEIANLIEDLLRRRKAGEQVDLDALCRAHPELMPELEKRLQAIDLGDRAEIEAQERDSITGTASRHKEGRPIAPKNIGFYRILEVLGEGGMGIVYRAQQTKPIKREVALKLIKLGMDTKQVIARFESERQALALMDHPNVAKVFDAGATDQGRPYFVMELVHGLPITEHCDRHRLSIDQRLDLFIRTCEAIQHAHQKGIIHRDIKPSNILVEYRDGQATPKIIDFGVAKATSQRLTEKTLFTEQGQMVGTPVYMSPEQADLSSQDIDTRSDIYSLGVLLYELLTGTLPFDAKSLRSGGFAEIQRIIRDEEPPKPSTRMSSGEFVSSDLEHAADSSSLEATAKKRRSDPQTLIKRIRGDLDWIVMKCLEKDRGRRYETANGLAQDVRRHLSNEPVLASPPSTGYRLRKLIKRNRTGAFAVIVIALALVSATIVSVGFALSEAEQRRIAVKAERDQSRARKEADQARVAEETQRKLAQQREADAIAARESEEEQRTLAEQRADELKTVTEFQQSVLRDIDPETMGRRIIIAQRAAIREGLESGGAAPAQMEAALASFDGLIARINATDLALKMVDENLLARAVETIHREFADQPLIRAALEQTVADTYRYIGLYERAMPLQQAALETRRHQVGDDHPSTLASISKMGALLRSMGKTEEALLYYREALESERLILGDDHPITLTALHNLASLLKDRGELEKAEQMFRRVLSARLAIVGPDHRSVLKTMNNLAVLLKQRRKFVEAESLYRDVLDALQRGGNEDSAQAQTARHNLATVLHDQGKQDDDKGKMEEAERVYIQSIDYYKRKFGDQHLRTTGMKFALAKLLADMGDDTRAAELHREVLETRRKRFSGREPDIARSLFELGDISLRLGYADKAEVWLRESLAIRRKHFAADDYRTANAENALGASLAAQGRFDEAEALLVQSLPIIESRYGAEGKRTKTAKARLADLHRARGTPEKAAADRADAGHPD